MIKSFKGGCSRTINLGNFESLRVEALVEMEVGTDDLSLVKNEAQAELRQLMEETYKAQHKIKS